MPAGKAPPSVSMAYDEDDEGENQLGVGTVSPLAEDDDGDGGDAAPGAIAPASPVASSIDLDEVMGVENLSDDGDDNIVDLLGSPESPQALAPDSLPLFDPNDPIEDFPAGESQPVGSHVDKASECEKGDDRIPDSRPVARPLNNVNPKSLPFDPKDDCPREKNDAVVADRPASSASGASSSSSGSTQPDRRAMLRDLLGKMSAMHQKLEAE